MTVWCVVASVAVLALAWEESIDLFEVLTGMNQCMLVLRFLHAETVADRSTLIVQMRFL